MPSPFVFAILLSYIVFLGGVVFQQQRPTAMVDYWFTGFWDLLEFTIQIVLVLVTGYVLAYHPSVRRAIGWLIRLPNSGKQAVVLVGVISMIVAWVQWGLGLIVGAVLAREMGRAANDRGIPVHYPLLCVAGYMGLGLTWHWGLAGSAPLMMNTPGNLFIEKGIVDGLISTSQTIFSSYSLLLTVLGIIYAAIALYLLSPTPENSTGITEYVEEGQLSTSTTNDTEAEIQEEPAQTIGDSLNSSRLIGGVIAVTGVGFTAWTFIQDGLGALNLNVVNFAFLTIGLSLYMRPDVYESEFKEAVGSASGIILQFPFYAGIIGMMNGSGLSVEIARALVSLSTPETFPAIAWITAGFINFFVPSGGGEWTVVGEIVLNAGNQLGVPPGQTIVAYAVGDAHTNLLQPFWALPLLGITGIRARDMFGYAATMMLLLIPFLAVALILIPY